MSQLPIPELQVRGFRCFRELHLERLGRLNLITGRNSVGKSFLLDALWLSAQRGLPSVVTEQLVARGEVTPWWPGTGPEAAVADDPAAALAGLFWGRAPIYELPSFDLAFGGESLKFSFVGDGASAGAVPQLVIACGTRFGQRVDLGLQPSSWWVPRSKRAAAPWPGSPSAVPAVHLDTHFRDWALLSDYWDRAGLGGHHEAVLRAMRLVDPDVELLQFVSEPANRLRRTPFVRVGGSREPVSLEVLGDGVAAVFAMMLCLVEAKGGVLLLDEAETGLHYSVQPDLWRLLLLTSRELDVQVFATTHSTDCIASFEQALATCEEGEGYLVRLQRKADRRHTTTYDGDDLAVVTRHHVEVR